MIKLPPKMRESAVTYLRRRKQGYGASLNGVRWASLIAKGGPLTESEMSSVTKFFMTARENHKLWLAYGGDAGRMFVLNVAKENLEQATAVAEQLDLDPFENQIASQLRPVLEDVETEIIQALSSAGQVTPELISSVILGALRRNRNRVNGTIESTDVVLVQGASNALQQIDRTTQNPITVQSLLDSIDDSILPDSTAMFQSIFDRLNSQLQKQMVAGTLDPSALAEYLRQNGVLTKRDVNGHDYADYYARWIVASRLWAGGHAGMLNYMAETGDTVERYWLSVGDERVRQTHRDNESLGWKGMEFNYPTGTFPGEEPQCRCVFVYQVAE